MNAEDIGDRLLHEVQEESLSEFLESIHLRRSIEDISWTGIDRLDHIVNVLLTASQRQSAKSIHQDFKKEKLFPLIEITSDKPGSGKTHILYHIITVAILPSHLNGVPLYGRNSTVVFFDTDLRFDTRRLSQVIQSYVIRRLEADSAAHSDELPCRQGRVTLIDLYVLVEEVLKHVHVIQQRSMDGLLESIKKLPHYLISNGNHCSAKRHLHSILIDSASAFYWESRARDDEKGDTTTVDTGMSYTKTSYTKLAQLLHRLQASFACMVLVTTWSYSRFISTQAVIPESQSWKSILAARWSRLPIVRIAVEQHISKNSQLYSKSLDYDTVGVSNSLSMRENSVETNFAAWLNEDKLDDWDDQVLHDLGQFRGVPSFLFTITDTGVFI